MAAENKDDGLFLTAPSIFAHWLWTTVEIWQMNGPYQALDTQTVLVGSFSGLLLVLVSFIYYQKLNFTR